MHLPLADSGSFLITPNVGIMVWTLIVFCVSLAILAKWVFPVIGAALDRRAQTIASEIDQAEELRVDAQKVLDEYRQRLHEARDQAEEIIERARKAAEARDKEALKLAQEERERQLAQARLDIEAETRRAIDEIRREVAELTVIATERLTRKSLNDADHRRLVEEALSELDFTALGSAGR